MMVFRGKKILPVIVIVSIALIYCFGFTLKKMMYNKTAVAEKGFAVVELFTSEGCSSCPSADALVSRILKENKKDVYILSFHVDYWDRLGWKDNFSQPAFSERQKQYASHLSSDGVYTPQIIVNGTDQFVGSNESHLRTALVKDAEQPSDLVIKAAKTNNSTIHLVYKITDNLPALLNIAFVLPEGITQVKRGENSGRELHHVNIVRQLRTIQADINEGSLDLPIPKELIEAQFTLIVYTQQKNTFKITGAAQAQIGTETTKITEK